MSKIGTFGELLVEQALGKPINEPITKKTLGRHLSEVQRTRPAEYGRVVSDIKALGDRLSYLVGNISIGLDEISVPDKVKRDQILREGERRAARERTYDGKMTVLGDMQAKLQALTTEKPGVIRDMLTSALGGKIGQQTKLSVSPGVVGGADGKPVPIVFKHSYAEGMSPVEHWLQATESRKNLADGQLGTAAPGELSKVMTNLTNESVISADDCHTKLGIQLFTKDNDILDRYLAQNTGRFARNTLITPDVQKELLRSKIDKVLVRSPQTCEAVDNTVCKKCAGLRNSTGRDYDIGDNLGLIATTSAAEPLTQMALSSKHSTTMAGVQTGLRGEKGFRALTEMPKIYPDRKVLCEVYGVITQILPAPQGGKLVVIRETRPVPKKYIVAAEPHKDFAKHWVYYIPPQRKFVEDVKVKAEVYPGMELTDGNDHLQDIARLRGLGVARSKAAEGLYNVYKASGQSVDRRHFEVVAKNLMNYVKVDKAPQSLPFNRGEVVSYSALRSAMNGLQGVNAALDDAIGKVLVKPIGHYLIGTELTSPVIEDLRRQGVKEVQVSEDLEVTPVVTPMSRTLGLKMDQWLGALNHRYLKDRIGTAARTGQSATIHGYNPIAAYAYGVEFGVNDSKDGKY